MVVEDFRINVSDDILNDLSRRLRNIKWANSLDNSNWQYGTNRKFLKEFIAYWVEEYDWKLQEKKFNKIPQFKCLVEDIEIHFLHIKGKGKNPLPIILSHGWPDSFIRYQKVIPFLTDPALLGKSPYDSFDIVIPSLPGFGFSSIPQYKGISNSDIAYYLNLLMTEKLGYKKFGALGGDIGSGVTRQLAYKYPENLIAIHLTDVGIIRAIALADKTDILTTEEKQYKQAVLEWLSQEGAYISIQSTKPLTLGYGLSDSPVGLSAWILEKFYSWSDCNGNLENRFTKNELLDNIMIYWLNNSIGTSNHIYFENTHNLPKVGKIKVPTGMALFSKDVLLPPRSWVERNFDLVHWSEIPEGGHFTAMESPELFAVDVINFFRRFRQLQ